jgi:hypothetical protein
METNYDQSDRHIYLYAKYWYQRTNILDDLRKIVSVRCAFPLEHTTKRDVEEILLDIVYDIFEREGFSRYGFTQFIRDCGKNSVIDTCLSFIAVSEMSTFEIDLGKPDPNVLPFKSK